VVTCASNSGIKLEPDISWIQNSRLFYGHQVLPRVSKYLRPFIKSEDPLSPTDPLLSDNNALVNTKKKPLI
jgi:hypothetical protein